jgi:hypothetical protein
LLPRENARDLPDRGFRGNIGVRLSAPADVPALQQEKCKLDARPALIYHAPRMHAPIFIATAAVAVLTAACASRIPQPANTAPGMPNVTWVLMYGDSDNPDQEFACQSDRKTDCVLPASRPGEQVFSDLHFYYHGTGGQTRYEGTRSIGHLQVTGSYTSRTDITVAKGQSIANQSVTGIVTSMPGTYAVTLSLTATMMATGKMQPVQETIPITVR